MSWTLCNLGGFPIQLQQSCKGAQEQAGQEALTFGSVILSEMYIIHAALCNILQHMKMCTGYCQVSIGIVIVCRCVCDLNCVIDCSHTCQLHCNHYKTTPGHSMAVRVGDTVALVVDQHTS